MSEDTEATSIAPVPGPAVAPSVSTAAVTATPVGPLTLAIDIGGTGLKASVLDAQGAMVADRVIVKTTYPCPPRSWSTTSPLWWRPYLRRTGCRPAFPA